MNVKRYFYASLAVFVFIFLFDWVFNGYLLHDLYEKTSSLWRPQDQMQANLYWIFIAQALFAFLFCYIFTKGYEKKGIEEGVRFGFLMGLLFATQPIMAYAVLPIPISLTIVWILGAIIELTLAGIIVAAIYRTGQVTGTNQ